jgi:hypothetical protein
MSHTPTLDRAIASFRLPAAGAHEAQHWVGVETLSAAERRELEAGTRVKRVEALRRLRHGKLATTAQAPHNVERK